MYLDGEAEDREGSSTENMTNEEWAYIAGLLDGEGCIYISKNRPSKRTRTVNPFYRLYVVISNTHLGAMVWLHNQLGGSLAQQKATRTSFSSNPIWNWRLSTRQAARFLEAVLPYLRIKKEQAEVALEFYHVQKRTWTGGGHVPKPKAEVDVLEQAYQVLRAMKRPARESSSGKSLGK